MSDLSLPLILMLVGGLMLLGALAMRRSPADWAVLGIGGGTFILLGLWPLAGEHSFVGWGLLAILFVPPVVGAAVLVRSFQAEPASWHRRGLRALGCLILVPALLLFGFVALGFMLGFHGHGYFNDPVNGTRNMVLTAIFIVSAAVILAGLVGIYRSLGAVDRNRLEIDDFDELALAQQRERRTQLVWGAAALAGAASIYVLLNWPSEPELQPGVIDCTMPGPKHQLC